jgi:hypothetical protein
LIKKSEKALRRWAYSQSLSEGTVFSPKNTLFWPNNRETGSRMTARTASKSLILHNKLLVAQFCRYFRELAPAVTRLGH